ncbi:MMPL family transporter [Mycobacterium tilburgii]
MIVLEAAKPLGDDAHAYYERLVAKLRAETRYVRSVPDLWLASGSPVRR